MTAGTTERLRLGWIGTGRMGSVLASRLLEHGCDLTVYNRTRAKAEPLAKRGARIVDRPADLGDRDIVITSVAGSRDFAEVMTGAQGLLANGNRVPRWSSIPPRSRWRFPGRFARRLRKWDRRSLLHR